MTMCSHLAKRVRAFSSCFYSSPQLQKLPFLTLALRSSLSTQTQTQPQKELPFIVDYLISSFGFSSDRALKYLSKSYLTKIKSPEQPEAVVKFLSETGLTDTQIKAVVSFQPCILAYSVDKAFKPNVRALLNEGCSQQLLVQLIRYNPCVLTHKGTHSRLQFWRDFVGKGDDEDLLKIFSRNAILLTLDIDKKIVPVINLLKEYGLSNADILLLHQHGTRFISRNLDSLRRTLELIDELGVLRGSKKFLRAVKAIGGLREGKIKNNVEFFKETYGWSLEDVNSAFRKHPEVLTYSENKVKANMDFLLGKAGFEPRSLASDPVLIGLSLERVLIPRYTVLWALKAKGLKIKCSLSTACKISARNFCEKYVVPFEKDVPGLGPAYASMLQC